MLSPTSLTAFASAGIPAIHASPAQRVRAPGAAEAPKADVPAPAPAAAPSRDGGMSIPPLRLLPRGSLVDLSV